MSSRNWDQKLAREVQRETGAAYCAVLQEIRKRVAAHPINAGKPIDKRMLEAELVVQFGEGAKDGAA